MAKFFGKISLKNKMLFFFFGALSYLIATFANCFTFGFANKGSASDSVVTDIISVCNGKTAQIAMYGLSLLLILLFYIRFFMLKRYKHKRAAAAACIAVHLLYFAVLFFDNNLEVFTVIVFLTALFDLIFMVSSITTSLHSQIEVFNVVIRLVSFICTFVGIIIFLFVPLGFEPGIFEVLIINFLVIALYLLMCVYYILPRKR